MQVDDDYQNWLFTELSVWKNFVEELFDDFLAE